MSSIAKFAEFLVKYAGGDAAEAAGNNVTNELAAAIKGGVGPKSQSVTAMPPAERGELVRGVNKQQNRVTGSQDAWANKLPALSAGSQTAAAQRAPAAGLIAGAK